MPPLVTNSPSDVLESESEYSSDDESTHSIPNYPSQFGSIDSEPRFAIEPETLGPSTSGITPNSVSHHVSGANASNGTKRKAESPAVNGHHPNKAPKTSDTSDSSASESEDDEEDMPVSEGPATPHTEGVLNKPGTPLHLFYEMFPQFKWVGERRSKVWRHLASLPVKRIPVITKLHRFNMNKLQNQPSFMMQATGELLPDNKACTRCVNKNSVYKGCVVPRDEIIVSLTNGACANCWYNRQGSQCSHKKGFKFKPRPPREYKWVKVTATPKGTVTGTAADSSLSQSQSHATDHDPVTPRPTALSSTSGVHQAHAAHSPPPAPLPGLPPPPPPTPTTTTPAAPPLHPAYVSALQKASNSAATTPDPDHNHSLPATTTGASITLDDRVRAWGSRYNSMPIAKLLTQQRHLMEWQEDLMTRMMAMNKVILQRLSRTGDLRSAGRPAGE